MDKRTKKVLSSCYNTGGGDKKKCRECNNYKPKDAYSSKQWIKPDGKGMCKKCAEKQHQGDKDKDKNKNRNERNEGGKKKQRASPSNSYRKSKTRKTDTKDKYTPGAEIKQNIKVLIKKIGRAYPYIDSRKDYRRSINGDVLNCITVFEDMERYVREKRREEKYKRRRYNNNSSSSD